MKKTEAIHPDDKPILAALRVAARAAAKEFGLYFTRLDHKWNANPGKSVGVCYPYRPTVVIRFWNFPSNCVRYRYDDPLIKTPEPGWWKNRLPIGEIVDTLAHELAHLRFTSHGYAHRGFTEDLLTYLKELPSIQKLFSEYGKPSVVQSSLNQPAGGSTELTTNT